MLLPSKITYTPRQLRLIAHNAPALVRIDDDPAGANALYTIHDRKFDSAIAPFLKGDWERFHARHRILPFRQDSAGMARQQDRTVYSGAVHPGIPKLPNITVLPNLETVSLEYSEYSPVVLGCTMGHYHAPDPAGPRVQEVYEFHGYGMLLLDHGRGAVDVWVAKAGDKVAVPDACHMTLYNLDDEDHPLVTLDFADPSRNEADKGLIGRVGPILLAYYDDLEAVFMLNAPYGESTDPTYGVRAGVDLAREEVRRVHVRRSRRLGVGRLLYEQLTGNPDVSGAFARMGLSIRRASPGVALGPPRGIDFSALYFSRPLVQSAVPGSEVYRYFFRDTPTKAPEPEEDAGSVPGAAGPVPPLAGKYHSLAERKRRLIAVEPLDRNLVVVVEGAGDWVTNAFRPRFQEQVAAGTKLSVFYADDSRWRQPNWGRSGGLEPWEVYLDKADPAEAARYRMLRPDVVFVVTPDYTHAEIAGRWVGRCPLVLVEKPFEVNLANVEQLLLCLGRRPGTAVLGLDHYLFYASPVIPMLDRVAAHLGGGLSEVCFYMTENRPIELGRERSLQHGLILDLIPHFLALLTLLGDLRSMDEFQVLEAMQYQPFVAEDPTTGVRREIPFHLRAETYGHVEFAFQDHSGTGRRVVCRGVVGKGLTDTVKYLEATGTNGNGVRIDFSQGPVAETTTSGHGSYPSGSIFLMVPPEVLASARSPVWLAQDPYDRRRTLAILGGADAPQSLDFRKYAALVADLCRGTGTALGLPLSLQECYDIVRALDVLYRAKQSVHTNSYTLRGRLTIR